jgi:hypothetical protein
VGDSNTGSSPSSYTNAGVHWLGKEVLGYIDLTSPWDLISPVDLTLYMIAPYAAVE